MSDFYKIKESIPKPGVVEIFPDFRIGKSKDIMIRGGKFYAVWDEEIGLWNTDEYRIQELVDNDLREKAKQFADTPGINLSIKYLANDSSGTWKRYRKFITEMPDNFHQLDERITFSDTDVAKKDYVSKRLGYPLKDGSHEAWDEMIGTLYLPEEREKIEWAIGAVVSGDSKSIQKFLVLYGDPGTGKGTILDIIKELFDSYAVSFDSGELTGLGNSFPMEQFRSNPLVAIQFDGDLSRIADNTKLNSLVSHEPMMMKEKFKSSYDFVPHCFLFLASNHPVKITDAKSGIIRRLIDVKPSLQKIPVKRYFQLKNQIQFELGAIASHCLQVYQDMGKHYYDGYKPVEMMFKTDAFFNFVDFYYLTFSKDDGVTLKNAYDMYKDYCEQSNIQRLPMYKFREELKNYFREFEPIAYVGRQQVRSWYSGFDRTKFDLLKKGEGNGSSGGVSDKPVDGREDGVSGYGSGNGTSVAAGSRDGRNDTAGMRSDGKSNRPVGCDEGNGRSVSEVGGGVSGTSSNNRRNGRVSDDGYSIQHGTDAFASMEGLPKWLQLGISTSLLDKVLAAQPAQYANEEGKPTQKWSEVTTRLGDIDTSKTHYVKPPLQHIVIDFDKKDKNGEKSLELNLKAAEAWKPTYAEVSKGGQGLHLHYIWDGDIAELGNMYEKDVEIKPFRGNASLRRRVSRCNDIPIAHLSSGLPRKEVKKTINFDAVKSERGLRDLIDRNLRKEIHPGTKPSIDFIEKILDDAYNQGLKYDVTDMRPDIMDFAMHSSHQAEYCLTRVAKMKFHSDEISDPSTDTIDDRFVFFDIEVFPNLLLINWKFAGDDHCQRMINPSSRDIEALMKYKLIGFNCRRYDNHIVYAGYLGRDNDEIYQISKGIIDNNKNCTFGEAYNISYTDVYDFTSKKQSLKKWEIQLGIHHQELGLPWDKPVPKEMWPMVAEYCDNDVFATEAVFNARQGDWTARKILANLADMSVNDTTNSLTTRIIFGKERHPKLNYRFLGGEPTDILTFPEEAKRLGCNPEYTLFNQYGQPVFPGYVFDNGVSTYRDFTVGEGGLAWGKPGIHTNVGLFDIASQHPHSMKEEKVFAEHQANFDDLLDARIFIKHGEYDKAKTLFGGKLAPYLDDPSQAKALSGALKIAINSVYGLTSAHFQNPFRDDRNIDNFVAKRGALFMINLKHEVESRGYEVVHIKTDSIKVTDPSPEIIQFIMDYGKLYGYTFEHEATYERMCLVNKAEYIARYNDGPHHYSYTNGLEGDSEWVAVGDRFIEPYTFKTLFSHEPIRFSDLCITYSCKSSLYLDMNEGWPSVTSEEKEYDKIMSKIRKMKKENPDIDPTEYSDLEMRLETLNEEIAKGHNYVFIGKVGLFAPVKKGHGGGLLMREQNGKMYAEGGSTGYRWIEAETISDHLEDIVDISYFTNMATAVIGDIEEFGDYMDFVDISGCSTAGLPWDHKPMCGESSYENCLDCPWWRIQLDQNNFEEMFACRKQ